MEDQIIPEMIPLRTRQYSCLFQMQTAFLRRVKSSGVEVIRAIYGALRDKNWDTVEPRLEIERIEQGDDSFSLNFTAHHESGPISFSLERYDRRARWRVGVYFRWSRRKIFPSESNPYCVLHPIIECAGKACRVQHSDGAWGEGSLPRFISPHQPFKDIQALSWRPSDHIQASIQFEGEVFEMEDQRNWTDASFKTYSTPLELPFPVELRAGEQIRQRAVLTFVADDAVISDREERRAKIAILPCSQAKRVPKIGLCVPLMLCPTPRSIENV